MKPGERILGAILAGGAARRFGSDKALAEWRGQTLIDHVRAALGPHVAGIVLCGRNLPDRPAPDLGPLGGLNAALAFAADHGFDRVLTAPCDAPLLGEALVRSLLASEGAAVVPQVPVIGIWPATLAPHLDTWLAAGGDRSVRRWAAAVGATPLDIADDAVPANVNTPADLARLD